MAYKPTKEDVDWAQRMVELIKQGGVLGFPSTALVYQIDHEAKTLTLQNEFMLTFEPSDETHKRTKVVFAKVGYKVTP